MIRRALRPMACLLLLAAGLLPAACNHPLRETREERLRDRMLATHRSYLESVAGGPLVEVDRPPSEVEQKLSPERRQELEAMSGVDAYENEPLDLGPNLLGESDGQTIYLPLEQAIRTAVRNNLTGQQARLVPAIDRTRITDAQSQFDAVFFADLNLNITDTPQPAAQIGLDAFGTVQDETRSVRTGIRKALTTGGQIQVDTGQSRRFRDPSFFNTNVWRETDVTVSLQQPLLRGFGQGVNYAQVELARNARDQSLADLKDQFIQIAANTEDAYWQLVFARHQLKIFSRLLDRTIEDRDRLTERREFDVSPVQLTEANSFVELRRADVIRARQRVRSASDRLKTLLFSRDLPVTGEALIVPTDRPADTPVAFNLYDAVRTALQERPELRQALSQIDDASIRQRVADNLRLPQADLTATVRYRGVGDDLGEANDLVTDGRFIDYVLGLSIEQPLGNRQAEARHRQRLLERQAAVINYQQQAQQVVLEVKEALRNLQAAHEIIGSSRAARLSAADNLRAIEEQERAGAALTPEFLLDLKLDTQSRLANAEIQESQALTDYHTAITDLYEAMGTLLRRNGISFEEQALAGGS